MRPFAAEVLAHPTRVSQTTVLILDQTEASERRQILMMSARFGAHALPLAWRVKETQGAIGFAERAELVSLISQWRPPAAKVALTADRFSGTPDLIVLG